MELMENERVDYVNDSLSLIQKTDGLTFGTDALLLAGYIDGKFDTGLEIGGGSGIISMLLLTRQKIEKIFCTEIQEEYAHLIERNASLNSLCDRLIAVHTDIRAYTVQKEYDIVFSNPPYMTASSGAHNAISAKTAARHEINGDIFELIGAGARLLRFGGTFAAVYRTDRLCDIICAMRECGVEPKRATFVHANCTSEPSMVLVEGKRGAKSGLRLTRPLMLYKDKSNKEYSEDMNYIMENGSFPDEFRKR